MAIEFNCPYCTAAIRVPDQYSGRKGTCPKCSTKLIVPDVVPKNTAPDPAPQQPTATQPVSDSEQTAADTSPPAAPVAQQPHAQQPHAQQPHAQQPIPGQPPANVPPQTPVAPATPGGEYPGYSGADPSQYPGYPAQPPYQQPPGYPMPPGQPPLGYPQQPYPPQQTGGWTQPGYAQQPPQPPFPGGPIPQPGQVGAVPQPEYAQPGVPNFSDPALESANVSKKMRRKNRRKRKQGSWSMVVAAVCFLIFFGVVAVVVTMKQPELKGNLRASLAGTEPLPATRVHFSTLKLTPEETADAAEAFQAAKETFLSPQLMCSLEASDTELKITVQPTGDGAWYTVNPNSDPTLMNWIRTQRDEILAAKRTRMVAAGAEMCRDKILKNSGENLAFNPGEYRDDFALNAGVDSFGYCIVAIANKKMSPCCYEDPNGTLYFCLPSGTTSFEIRGRDFEGKRWFPGNYTVNVEGGSVAAPPAATEVESDASDEDGEWDPLQPAPGSFPEPGDDGDDSGEMQDGEGMQMMTPTMAS